MIEYPFVFAQRGQLLMAYNGNDYGKSGCGLALNVARAFGFSAMRICPFCEATHSVPEMELPELRTPSRTP